MRRLSAVVGAAVLVLGGGVAAAVAALPAHADTQICAQYGSTTIQGGFDAEDPLPRRSPGKVIGLGLLGLLACGFTYEQLGEWQFRHRFPQIGRSVDIGGRSPDICCSGSGTPAVIFEAVHAAPGYSWLPIQRAIAVALTRREAVS